MGEQEASQQTQSNPTEFLSAEARENLADGVKGQLRRDGNEIFLLSSNYKEEKKHTPKKCLKYLNIGPYNPSHHLKLRRPSTLRRFPIVTPPQGSSSGRGDDSAPETCPAALRAGLMLGAEPRTDEGQTWPVGLIGEKPCPGPSSPLTTSMALALAPPRRQCHRGHPAPRPFGARTQGLTLIGLQGLADSSFLTARSLWGCLGHGRGADRVRPLWPPRPPDTGLCVAP